MRKYCDRRCPHGGVCTLAPGHDGKHAAVRLTDGSVMCTFTEAEAISHDEGDALMERAEPGLVAFGKALGAWPDDEANDND